MADKFWVSTYTVYVLSRGDKPIEPEWGDWGYNLMTGEAMSHEEESTQRELTVTQMRALIKLWGLDPKRLDL